MFAGFLKPGVHHTYSLTGSVISFSNETKWYEQTSIISAFYFLNAPVAQQEVQHSSKVKAAGSSPVGGTTSSLKALKTHTAIIGKNLGSSRFLWD